MFKKWINWIKTLNYIINHYDANFKWLKKEIKESMQIIKDRTNIHADIHYRSSNQVIVVGRYNGRDYVQTYNVNNKDFKEFILQLRSMEKYGHIRRIDHPIEFKGVFEHEFDI